jgi:fructose-bisphosphate aldolase class I
MLKETYAQLYYAKVPLEQTVLKPNMVISGKKCGKQASRQEVAERTVKILRRCVPVAVPGIAFLSGGQSDEDATAHLSLMNQLGPLPWKLSFSYGRALQAACLKAWGGKPENVAAGQRAFAHRAKMNGVATLGKWTEQLEKAA